MKVTKRYSGKIRRRVAVHQVVIDNDTNTMTEARDAEVRIAAVMNMNMIKRV